MGAWLGLRCLDVLYNNKFTKNDIIIEFKSFCELCNEVFQCDSKMQSLFETLWDIWYYLIFKLFRGLVLWVRKVALILGGDDIKPWCWSSERESISKKMISNSKLLRSFIILLLAVSNYWLELCHIWTNCPGNWQNWSEVIIGLAWARTWINIKYTIWHPSSKTLFTKCPLTY